MKIQESEGQDLLQEASINQDDLIKANFKRIQS